MAREINATFWLLFPTATNRQLRAGALVFSRSVGPLKVGAGVVQRIIVTPAQPQAARLTCNDWFSSGWRSMARRTIDAEFGAGEFAASAAYWWSSSIGCPYFAILLPSILLERHSGDRDG